MEAQQLREIFLRYINKEASEEEAKALLEHFSSGRESEYLQELIAEHLDGEMPIGFEELPHIKAALSDVHQNIKEQINREEEFDGHAFARTRPITKKLMPWISIAALLAVGMAIVYYFYFLRERVAKPVQNNAIAIDVSPGHSGATLTLADGRKIVLNAVATGKIAQETGGISISKTADGQLIYSITENENKPALNSPAFNTLATTKGETYQVMLPDGSKVWLNASSSIKYPGSFSAQRERRVELHGEAYFEVAHNKVKPFIVRTDAQDVIVLGTHFNINSYADEPQTITTLEEGSVRVSRHPELVSGSAKQIADQARNEVVIKPGEQVINGANVFKAQQADLQTALAWKNGRIYFKKTDLKTIMRQVARWYDVEVEYKGQVPDRLFTGGVYRNANLSELLKILQLNDIHFTIKDAPKGKTLIVEP